MDRHFKFEDCFSKKHPVNCVMVLDSFHNLIKEAEEVFKDANEAQQLALTSAIAAIEALVEAMKLVKQGDHMLQEAYEFLEESGCDHGCNMHSCHCEHIQEEADEYFDISNHEFYEAYCLLKEVIHKLKKAIYFEEKGVALEIEYVECVHAKKDCHCGH